jgi:two-component system, LytTR family, sensor kinase
VNLDSQIQDRSSRNLYWLCQFGGWTALALYQSSVRLSDSSGHLPPVVTIAEPFLAALYGLSATHLLYLYLQHHRWLQKLGSKFAARLASVILILATTLNALDLSSIFLLDRWFTLHVVFSRRIVLLSLGSWFVVLIAWMALYLCIHELRRRRSQEALALRMEVIAQETQLRGLRAQLNPHFFFNCLNSLREMVAENPQRAQLMVTQLSDLMRYALQSNQVDLVSLASEVQAVQDYLALETIRFEERLQVRWDISAGALDLRVPPMLLQTLVENALKHGIALREEGGEIKIVIRHRDSEIHLAGC